MAKKELLPITKDNYFGSFTIPEEIKKFIEGCVYYDTDPWGKRQYFFKLFLEKRWQRIYISQNADKVFTIYANYRLVEQVPENIQRSLRISGFNCGSTSLGDTILAMVKYIKENKYKKNAHK